MLSPDQQRFFFQAVVGKLEQCFEDYFEQSMSSSVESMAVMAEVRYNQCIRDLIAEYPLKEIRRYADELSVKCEVDRGTVKVIYSEQLALMETGEATFQEADHAKHSR
jgi:hypothetical protein